MITSAALGFYSTQILLAIFSVTTCANFDFSLPKSKKPNPNNINIQLKNQVPTQFLFVENWPVVRICTARRINIFLPYSWTPVIFTERYIGISRGRLNQ